MSEAALVAIFGLDFVGYFGTDCCAEIIALSQTGVPIEEAARICIAKERPYAGVSCLLDAVNQNCGSD